MQEEEREIRAYEARVRLLEDRIAELRLSRRVLMDLLERARQEQMAMEKKTCGCGSKTLSFPAGFGSKIPA